MPGKLQKHKAFVSEVEANEARINNVKEKGDELVNADHYASENIKSHLDDMLTKWDELKVKADEKGLSNTILLMI